MKKQSSRRDLTPDRPAPASGKIAGCAGAAGVVFLETPKGIREFDSEAEARSYEIHLEVNPGSFPRVSNPASKPPPKASRPRGKAAHVEVDFLEAAHEEHSGALIGLALQDGARWAELKDTFLRSDFWPEHAHLVEGLWDRDIPPEAIPLAAAAHGPDGPLAHELVDAAPVDRNAWTYHARELRRVLSAQSARLALLGTMEKIKGCGPDATEAGIVDLRCALSRLETGRGGAPEALDAGAWSAEHVPPPVQLIDGALDAGTKGIIVGPSKSRKSFFALQTALSLATGRPFLYYRIPEPRRVLLWQAEILPAHYHARLVRMMDALGITPEELGGRFKIINGRGWRFSEEKSFDLLRAVEHHKADVFFLDPAYKFLCGNESDPEVVTEYLAMMDDMAERTGAAVVTVHHAAKGHAGDREAIDRTSGSGYWARDFDCQFSLTPHKDDGLLVFEPICRSYPPREAVSVVVSDALTFGLSDTAAEVRTSANARRGWVPPAIDIEAIGKIALDIVKIQPLPVAVFDSRFQTSAKLGDKAARRAKAELLHARIIAMSGWNPKKGGGKYIGNPEEISLLCEKWESEKND